MNRRFLLNLGLAISISLLTADVLFASAKKLPAIFELLLISDDAMIDGLVVHNDLELVAAITEGQEDIIIVAPGTYSTQDMVKGLDRQSKPLTIRGLSANNKPIFLDATQSLIRTRYVTIKDLKFVATGAPTASVRWFYDGGGNGTGGGTNNIVLDGLEFYSPAPDSLTDPNQISTYGDDMLRLFQFSNIQTHNYTIQNIYAEYAYSVGDFRMNGDVLLNKIVVDKWYFDGIRIIGLGEEGYVEGDRIIANVDLIDNIAVYNEINGINTPHPDNTQKFNSGTTVNNTDPRVVNTLFYHNRFNPGQLRSNNTQSGLSQSYELNVGYVENIYGNKASAHGISLERGANGVLIERNTLVDVNWVSSPWIRIFRADGQVAVYDNYFKGGFDFDSSPNENRSGYEMNSSGNVTSTDYSSFFKGPAQQLGIAGLMAMFTPKTSPSVGALTAGGQWRNLPHRPMMATAPLIEPRAGGFKLAKLFTPTLWSPDQARLGADNCLSKNIRWSPIGAFSWTEIANVVDGDILGSVASERVEVQTQCVNVAGPGLWSRSSEVTIN